MINKHTLVPRRTFFRQGIVVSVLFLLVPTKWSLFLSKRLDMCTNIGADTKDDLLLNVVQRYGSEFGDIMPQVRRIDHGRV